MNLYFGFIAKKKKHFMLPIIHFGETTRRRRQTSRLARDFFYLFIFSFFAEENELGRKVDIV